MTAASLLQSLTEFVAEMDAEYQSIVLDPDNEAEVLTILACAVRDLRQDLAELGKTIEADLIASAGNKRFIVPEVGEVTIRKSTRGTGWDNKSLWNLLAAYVVDERKLDETTGEYEPREQAVARVLGEACNPSWRVTALRERGIDESEYCTVDEAHYAVQLPPRTVPMLVPILAVPQPCTTCDKPVPWEIAVAIVLPNGVYGGVRHPDCKEPDNG